MKPEEPKHSRWAAALAAIIALATALRLYGLSTYSIWYDESTTLYALQFVNWDLTFLTGGIMRLIPLYPFLLFFWHGLVEMLPGLEMGSELSDFLLRLISVGFGVATVPLIFYAARYLTGSTSGALIAALLLAISPFHIYYAQELRPHTLYALLVLAAQIYVYRALEENRIRLWVAAVALSSLSFYAYYFSAFFMVAINLYVLALVAVYRPLLKRWIISQICLGLSLFPVLIMALFVYQVYTNAEEFWFPKPDLQVVGITLKNYFAGYSPRSVVYWPVFLLASAALTAGAWSVRNRPRAAIFLIIMSLGPLLVQVVFWSTQEFAFYTYRAQLAYSPTVFILAGAGIAWVRPLGLRAGVLGLLLVLTVPLLADHYGQRLHPIWKHRIAARYKADMRGAAEHIKTNMREGDFVAHSSTYSLSPFRFHYLDVDQAYVGFTDQEWLGHLKSFPDEEIWKSMGFVPRRIETVSKPAKRVWYVRSWWEPDDPAPLTRQIRAWYDATAVRIDQRAFDGVMLYLYDMEPTLRAATRTDWIADFGRHEVPLYRFAAESLSLEEMSTWESALRNAYPPEPNAFDGGLDVWMDVALDDVPAVTIASEGDSYRATLHLANRLEGARTVSIRAFQVGEVIRGLSLMREEDSDVWRPQHAHESKIAYRATLTEDASRGTLSGEVTLAPGSYGLYAQAFQAAGPDNDDRGLLRVNTVGAHGERIVVGEVSGHDPAGEAGWDWRYVGTVESHGSPVELELIAENTSNLPQAEFDLGRLMFVDFAHANPEGPDAFWTHEETLVSWGESAVEFRGTYPTTGRERVYVEFRDADMKIFRSLAFDIGQSPEGISQ